MPNSFLPYGRHTIDEDDIAAVAEVMRGDFLTSGPKAAEFETAFANKIGAKEAVVLSNGTTALHLAVIAAGIGTGDKVIVPAITFLATANVVEMVGAEVVFADVSPETGLLTIESFNEAVCKAGDSVKAVMPVHLTGQAQDMAEIYAIAKRANISVITDCCHAIGAEYVAGGRPGDGQFEDFACYSLHPVKSIAMGEGGIVTTNGRVAAKKIRQLRSHDMRKESADFTNTEMAFDKSGEVNPWYYEMHSVGYNYRASDMQCALGLSQLSKLDGFVEKRRELAALYDKLLKPLSSYLTPNGRSDDCMSAWHLYAVRINFNRFKAGRAVLMQKLKEEGVGTQVHYIPVSKQPFYEQKYGKQNLPGVDAYYNSTLSLPLFPTMMEEDVVRVVTALHKILNA